MTMSGDIFDCHDRQKREAGCYWYLVGRRWEAAKHPTMHRTAPQQKTIQSKMSRVTRLRKPVTEEETLAQEVKPPAQGHTVQE